MIGEQLPQLPADDSPRRNERPHRGAVLPTEAAIAAAFAAFHRRAAHISAGAYARTFLAGGGWVFVGLALLGFAGGLFLARVSFNTPEHPINVADHPPEMLYTKPRTTDTAPRVVGRNPDTGADATSIAATARPVNETESDKAAGRPVPNDHANAESELLVLNSSAEAPLPDATANLAAAMRLGAIAATQVPGHRGGDVTVGYDGVELPSVPEPANGAIVAIGVAGLIGVSRLTRMRRRRSRS